MTNLQLDFLSAHFGLNGRVALVTGARQGIGAEVATCLASAGAQVAVAARRPADLGAAVAAIQAVGGEALPLGFDVQDTSAIAAAITTVADHFGRLDILVNNAGV
ncbi:MAG: SDR family NAD(P)-dependent oxidoreductase, partial [Candidatus Dormibacteraceae bacterium]